jgi:hypothetical protein
MGLLGSIFAKVSLGEVEMLTGNFLHGGVLTDLRRSQGATIGDLGSSIEW